MDVKFSFSKVLLLFAILTIIVETTSAGHRSRGIVRITSRRHNRREVRDYLAPPSQDASYTSYGVPSLQPPPLIPYRPGRLLNPPPPVEEQGYFSRLASWLNPFGGSPTPPPLPDIPVLRYPAKYGQPYAPSHGYGPPLAAPSQSYGLPVPQPPPPGPQGYLPPPGKGKNCNPCNNVPWIPMPGVAQKDTYGSGTTNVEIQPSVAQEAKNAAGGSSLGYTDEIRTPDFSYGLPSSSNPSHAQLSSHGNPPSGPIPYPHLYPGPMPPLYKAKPFDTVSGSFQPTPSVEITSGPGDHPVDSILTVSGPSKPDPEDGHVEVLPPGAEIDTSGLNGAPPPGYEGEIRDSPPSGYGGNRPQQSATIHEEHLSTELTSGYKIQEPQGQVDIVKSIPTAEYSSSIDHPIHFEESPLIDLSKDDHKDPQTLHHESQSSPNDYTAGLNPPPNELASSYDTHGVTGGLDDSKNASPASEVPANSYQEPPRDSFVASTVSNRSVVYPTPTYNIPDVGELPISHETVKPNVYENYPPTTEKFFISVQDSINNSRGPFVNAVNSPDHQAVGGSAQDQRDSKEQQEPILNSYQQHVDPSFVGQDNLNSQPALIKNPVPLVPYRPSSLYVPYPPFTEPNSQNNSASSLPNPQAPGASGPTTAEPFLEALLKSYNNFKQEMAVKDQLVREHQDRMRIEGQQNRAQGTTWISQPQPSFSVPERINPSIYSNGNFMPPPMPNSEIQQQQQQPLGVKRNKQVQIIIPYTSQYTPSPFQPATDDWSGRGPLEQTQARKAPLLDVPDQNYIGQESKNVEVTRTLRPLENLLSKEIAKKPSTKQANNSIDVLRLQKNIDNWTIQEYSRGMTSSTALPSSSHPYLLPSKNIPHEYLTSTQSSAPEERIDSIGSDLAGFSYNDLEHEVAASSRVDVPHVQILRVEGVSDTGKASNGVPASSSTSATSISTSTTTEASWAELPVSISPHNNERVYVVTPQPAKSRTEPNDANNSDKYEAIERAYQVLPQAVNNLASASVSGPENSPLWGIMEHEEYAKNGERNSTTSVPILYSGHSKVSKARH